MQRKKQGLGKSICPIPGKQVILHYIMYKHLNLEQRYGIFSLLANKISLSQIARTLNISVSTVSREIKRNSGKRGYHHKLANEMARERRIWRVSIHDRPPEADGTRFGDWEMDTIVGKNGKGAIVTLTERSTNYIMMKRLKHGKNPKELAQVVKWMLFPYRHFVKTITTDNGSEFCEHRLISKALGATIYFADPYSSWQKGAIENTNKLIRQYIPKRTDFKTITDEQLLQIQYKINKRPRKKLHFYDPKTCFFHFI